MDSKRRCTKSSCETEAVATLTYSYADQTIVVGPISVYAEPHTYDLCTAHADGTNPPRGWEILRLDYRSAAEDDSDLLALAEAVREPRAAAGPMAHPPRQARQPLRTPPGEPAITRGPLRLLRD